MDGCLDDFPGIDDHFPWIDDLFPIWFPENMLQYVDSGNGLPGRDVDRRRGKNGLRKDVVLKKENAASWILFLKALHQGMPVCVFNGQDNFIHVIQQYILAPVHIPIDAVI